MQIQDIICLKRSYRHHISDHTQVDIVDGGGQYPCAQIIESRKTVLVNSVYKRQAKPIVDKAISEGYTIFWVDLGYPKYYNCHELCYSDEWKAFMAAEREKFEAPIKAKCPESLMAHAYQSGWQFPYVVFELRIKGLASQYVEASYEVPVEKVDEWLEAYKKVADLSRFQIGIID